MLKKRRGIKVSSLILQAEVIVAMMCRVSLLSLLAVAVVAPSSDTNTWVGCGGHEPTCKMLQDLYNACNGGNWQPGP